MFGFTLQSALPLGEIHWFGVWIPTYEATVVGSSPYVYLVKHNTRRCLCPCRGTVPLFPKRLQYMQVTSHLHVAASCRLGKDRDTGNRRQGGPLNCSAGGGKWTVLREWNGSFYTKLDTTGNWILLFYPPDLLPHIPCW